MSTAAWVRPGQAQSWDLSRVFPHGCQGSRYCVITWCCPRHLDRKLDWKHAVAVTWTGTLLWAVSISSIALTCSIMRPTPRSVVFNLCVFRIYLRGRGGEGRQREEKREGGGGGEMGKRGCISLCQQLEQGIKPGHEDVGWNHGWHSKPEDKCPLLCVLLSQEPWYLLNHELEVVPSNMLRFLWLGCILVAFGDLHP